MNNVLRAAVAAVVVAGVALASAGPASADNSNSNTNTNDVTNQGGGVSAGVASGGVESTNWPPTDVSWPPSAVMNGDVGSKDKENAAATPIVAPLGQAAPNTTPAPSTPETTTPIVPVGAP
jgi:hypothetical protein